jgi:YARHG domain-containing protein
MPSVKHTLVALLLLAACDRANDTAPAPSAKPASTATATATTTATATATATATPAPARQLYYDRPITPDDLQGRSLRELSLMRNWIYARAGNPFRNPWLHEFFAKESWYQPKDQMDEAKLSELDKKNARAIADADAALDREALEVMRDAVVARRKSGTATAEDAVEIGLLSQRFGTWLGGERDEAPTALEDPAQLDRLVRVEELATLSRRDLRMLRNMVYARRGRAFESKVVQEYFKDAAWYHPDPSFHEGMLTGTDHKNIRIIRSVEDSLGGPLHENPNYGKEGWFFAA